MTGLWRQEMGTTESRGLRIRKRKGQARTAPIIRIWVTVRRQSQFVLEQMWYGSGVG